MPTDEQHEQLGEELYELLQRYHENGFSYSSLEWHFDEAMKEVRP